MHPNRLSLLAAALVAASLSACDKARPLGEESSASSNCGTCHGNPPTVISATGAPHPDNTNCHACHSTSVDASGNVIPVSAGGTHGDGKIEGGGHVAGYGDPAKHGPDAIADLTSCQACHGATYDGAGGAPSCNACHADALAGDWKTNCTFCHGTQTANYTSASLAKAAPPKGVAGETDSTDLAVGAHATHVSAGPVTFSCDACHGALPVDLSHVKGQDPVVQFSSFAGGTAQWDRTTGKCSNVYCHGATLTGGSVTQPLWTKVDGTQAACGTCHGAPPSSGQHTLHAQQGVGCGKCHPAYTATSVDPGAHVDGQIGPAVVQGSSGPVSIDRWPAGSYPSGCACHTVNGVPGL